MKKDCACVPNCDEVNYVIEHKDSREWFLGSNLQWGLKEYPRMRLKRDVLFGFADVLGKTVCDCVLFHKNSYLS